MHVSVVDQMFDPIINCLTPEVAYQMIESRLDPATQSHIVELACKANRGTISTAERAEYAEFVEWIDLIAILKTKIAASYGSQHNS